MTRLLLRFVPAPVMLFAALALAVSHLAVPPSSTVLVQTAGCHLPCWNGITPGETTFNQALRILETQGYQKRASPDDLNLPGQYFYVAPQQTSICQVGLTNTRAAEAVVREVSLWFCQPQALGDLMLLMDLPDSILPLTSLLAYPEGRVVFVLGEPFCDKWLSPQSIIRSISLSDDDFNQPLFYQAIKQPWRGFLPSWLYERLFSSVC